ncbi:hypothetical protein [Candidatus Poriferisodalis sp.]
MPVTKTHCQPTEAELNQPVSIGCGNSDEMARAYMPDRWVTR